MNPKPLKIGVVIPVANESPTIIDFTNDLINELAKTDTIYKIYFIIDKVSKDDTDKKIKVLERTHPEVELHFVPENRNVVDAYINGFKVAIKDSPDAVIEMDAGFSHKPKDILKFIDGLKQEYECVFGVRPLCSPKYRVPLKRRVLSLGGTILANILLGTKLSDMTSGFEAFKTDVLQKVIEKPFESRGHFYQTEMRYRCKGCKSLEVAIDYEFPSKSVSSKSINNSFFVLLDLFKQRLKF